jgi:exosortase C (VPDSG-CTERM-specific)
MSELSEATTHPLVPNQNHNLGRICAFALVCLVLILCFSKPLFDLVRFSVSSDLYSHIVLLPFIAGYLIWLKRHNLPAFAKPDVGTFAVFAGAGLIALAVRWPISLYSVQFGKEDSLALAILSFMLLFTAVCSWFLGRPILRMIAFPIGFLFLIIPFPTAFTRWLEGFLQQQSASAAFAFFKLSGTTVYRHDLVFQLPGISIEVAPQCSGIHSSVALFITSLLAGYLFLNSVPKRCLLAAVVLPLGIIRNGFRVFTIGELCVHVGPQMIDSEIHHHGGPVFFALSLIPFLLLLYFLARSERRPTKLDSANS